MFLTSDFFLPLPRTRTDCVRAFEHINYLLMLTFEGDAFFVLTPTAGVNAVFTSAGPLPRQQTEPHSQRESAELDLEILESGVKRSKARALDWRIRQKMSNMCLLI